MELGGFPLQLKETRPEEFGIEIWGKGATAIFTANLITPKITQGQAAMYHELPKSRWIDALLRRSLPPQILQQRRHHLCWHDQLLICTRWRSVNQSVKKSPWPFSLGVSKLGIPLISLSRWLVFFRLSPMDPWGAPLNFETQPSSKWITPLFNCSNSWKP